MCPLLTVLPSDDRKLLDWPGPLQAFLGRLELLHPHRKRALADLVAREPAQMRREPDRTTRRDEPFRRVVLVPLDRVPVVHWELMMEVMVPFAERDKCGEEMVPRSVLVIKRCMSERVCERIDTPDALGEMSVNMIMPWLVPALT